MTVRQTQARQACQTPNYRQKCCFDDYDYLSFRPIRTDGHLVNDDQLRHGDPARIFARWQDAQTKECFVPFLEEPSRPIGGIRNRRA